MRKRQRYLMPPLPQSSIQNQLSSGYPALGSWKLVTGDTSEAPIIQKEIISDLLCRLDPHKSMGHDGIHPQVIRELAKELAKPLSIIYQQSRLTGEGPADWKLENVMPIYKKSLKDDPGNCRPVSLTSVMEEGYGRNHPECPYMALTGQPGDQAQTT
ncbi:LINE-1 reverse transcriptase [Pitangus sulphuratus]|nr:LINE-1 reverse transcriptase [Pitangus sulphuratus]